MRGNHWGHEENDLTIMIPPLDKALYHHDDEYGALLAASSELYDALHQMIDCTALSKIRIDSEEDRVISRVIAALKKYNKLTEYKP